jgi:uncharacterized protein (TIGR02285 family)
MAVEGNDPKTEAMGKIIAHLQKRMSHYDHQSTVVNASVLRTMMKEKRNICSSWVIGTPERMELGYLTDFYPQPPHGIVIRTQDIRLMHDIPRGSSLKYLLEHTKLRLGIEKDRSYGESLDKILKNNTDPKIIQVTASSGSDVLIKMLIAGRVDYILEYPHVIAYYNKALKLDPPLVVNDADESKHAIIIKIMCSKNEWGRKISRELDFLLQQYAREPEFREIIESSYSDDIKAKYGKEFEKFYRDRAKGPMTTAPIEKAN